MESYSEAVRGGCSGGINQAVCEQKPQFEAVQRLREVYSPPVEPSGPQTSSLSGTVVMRRISSTTRLQSVCVCTHPLMDNL